MNKHKFIISLPNGNMNVEYNYSQYGILLKSVYIEWLKKKISFEDGEDFDNYELKNLSPIDNMLYVISHGDSGGQWKQIDKSLYSIILHKTIEDYFLQGNYKSSSFKELKYIYLSICYSGNKHDNDSNIEYTSSSIIGTITDYLASSLHKIVIGSTGIVDIHLSTIKPEKTFEGDTIFLEAGLVVSYVNKNNELITKFYRNCSDLIRDNIELTNKLFQLYLNSKNSFDNFIIEKELKQNKFIIFFENIKNICLSKLLDLAEMNSVSFFENIDSKSNSINIYQIIEEVINESNKISISNENKYIHINDFLKNISKLFPFIKEIDYISGKEYIKQIYSISCTRNKSLKRSLSFNNNSNKRHRIDYKLNKSKSL